ncbi:short-chain dehydrogenase [Acidocella aquatica]|uniref:Short-chain dehydrogenase n=1 Tax=Acidocella aquatica TaxID=1922313 RepID=A0ABQ6A8Q1_9PROT|nr:SDR family NAD(P)-dependent oxidoreductase [Acidocella aquatica]GLR68874.1 short-chain dehydrogenase [Acidocella aquatica]
MQYQTIAITGASSGLGQALALGYAAPGVTLHLAGRNVARLAQTAAAAQAKGARVTQTIADVTDRAAMADWVAGLEELDLMIANAGVSAGPGRAHRERDEQIRRVFATDLDGVFNTILPAMARKTPRIAIIGSIAGLIALPTSPAYSAAKAALDCWVRAAAPGAAREGIALTLVRPGFIRTPMTAQNPYPMPGMLDAGEAARRIIRGIAAGRAFITFPWWFAALARVANLAPKSLFARVPGKPSQT